LVQADPIHRELTPTMTTILAQTIVAILCLLSALPGRAASFVEVTAEIEGDDWDYWLFSDRLVKHPGEAGTSSIFTKPRTTRCVVGADTWMIESEFPTSLVTRWFTGTNIIEHTVITQQTPDADIKKMSERSKLVMTAPPVGHSYTRIHESVDGNPGRPVRVPDLMGFDFPATVSWLAFCSAPALKREGRRIYPPSDFWKQSSLVYSGWSDVTEVFDDDLGLPRSINLTSTNNQSIFQYQVRRSTNVLGWDFPLEFYGVQYLPTGTNAWKLHMTLKGRVTKIGPSPRPEIPPQVMTVIQR
jgi:hypothetical protein